MRCGSNVVLMQLQLMLPLRHPCIAPQTKESAARFSVIALHTPRQQTVVSQRNGDNCKLSYRFSSETAAKLQANETKPQKHTSPSIFFNTTASWQALTCNQAGEAGVGKDEAEQDADGRQAEDAA